MIREVIRNEEPMYRVMIDFTHDNLPAVLDLLPHYDLAAIYGTGSSDIQETLADITRIRSTAFDGKPLVMIDQGFTGSPQPLDTIRDVETGAWTPHAAVTEPWDAENPTIYCTRDTLPQVQAEGWKGRIWLAWPGFSSITAPVFEGVTV